LLPVISVWYGQVMRLIHAALGLSMLSALAGCGGKSGGVSTVEGAVQQGGKPLAGGTGTVTFVSSTGLRLTAPIDPTGHYLLYNPPEGAMKIGVTLVEYMTLEQAMRPGQGPPRRLIPAKYADPEKSGLTLTVGKGKQTYDIDLPP
jgi:hypothetical protein